MRSYLTSAAYCAPEELTSMVDWMGYGMEALDTVNVRYDFTCCSPFRECGGVTPGENKSGSIGDGANRTLIVVVSIHKLVEQFGIHDHWNILILIKHKMPLNVMINNASASSYTSATRMYQVGCGYQYLHKNMTRGWFCR